MLSAMTSSSEFMNTDDKTKAELFNEYFASVGAADDGVRPVCTNSINCTEALDTITFSVLDLSLIHI